MSDKAELTKSATQAPSKLRTPSWLPPPQVSKTSSRTEDEQVSSEATTRSDSTLRAPSWLKPQTTRKRDDEQELKIPLTNSDQHAPTGIQLPKMSRAATTKANEEQELTQLFGGLTVAASTKPPLREGSQANVSPATSPTSKVERNEVMRAYYVYRKQLDKCNRAELPKDMEPDGYHHDLFLQSLKRHPKAGEKIGCGVDRIIVRRIITPRGEDVCACVVKRIDGTEEDFSLLR